MTAAGFRAFRARRVARAAKRAGVATVGITLLGAGATLLVLPGPGLVVIVAGLAVLATEFAWAERRLQQTKTYATSAAAAARRASRRTTTSQTADERSHP